MLNMVRFLRPYRNQIYLIFALVFGQSMADLFLPTLMAKIVDTGIVTGDTAYILRIGAFMLLIAVGGMTCSIIASFYSSRVAVGFGRLIRTKLFAHVSQFSLHEFDKISTASLITRTTNDTNQVQTVFIIMLRMMISAPLMLVGGIILATAQDASLSWVLVSVIPVLAIAIFLIMRQAIPLFQAVQLKLDKLNLILDEGLTGVRVVRAFDRTSYEQDRFARANGDLTATSIQVNRVVASLMPVMMFVLNMATVAIIWFGGFRIDRGEMQIGSLIAFLQYAMQILFALIMLSMLFIMLPRAAASASRINKVLEIEPEIVDPETPKTANPAERGEVVFDHVTFRYPGAEEPAIADISFRAKPGQITAIIGGTGAGKSTLVNLIPRFYDIESGSITVDGVDVHDYAQEDLRSKIGFIPQRAVLFSGSIKDNILFGKEDATPIEVAHSAAVAQASDFIGEMASGYDSRIEQGGQNVSGGQKQRLSIARALVRHPEIYVFDDSFSALDFKTDSRLRAALKQETTDATVFIVAQRVSTIMDADQIIVLENGAIAGIGTHRELLETTPAYKEIVSSQLNAEEMAR